MRYESGAAFLKNPQKRVSLMGMSNVGKTHLASLLPQANWFHYSVDYRIATKHLREPMIDVIKLRMMKDDYLAEHLRGDSVTIELNVSYRDLSMISNYLGKLGTEADGGLDEVEFTRRQTRHRHAEIAAIRDIPEFIERASAIYGYPHFIADTSGSLCEIVDLSNPCDPTLHAIAENTVLIYIAADSAHEAYLAEMAQSRPKPLYYRPDFVANAIRGYQAQFGVSVAQIDPDRFVRWVFPLLLEARRPRYEQIARQGYTVAAGDAASVASESDLMSLIASAIDRHERYAAPAQAAAML